MYYVHWFSCATSRELNTRNSSSFFVQSQGTLPGFLAHFMCFVCFVCTSKDYVSCQVFFQFSLYLGLSLSPLWSNLALLVLDRKILLNFLPQTPEIHASVPMPPSRRTHSVAAKQVNIPADLDLDGLYVKDLRNLLSRLNLPATGTRSTLFERLKEARESEQALSQANVVRPPFKMAATTLNSSNNLSSYNNRSKTCWTSTLPTTGCCLRAG